MKKQSSSRFIFANYCRAFTRSAIVRLMTIIALTILGAYLYLFIKVLHRNLGISDSIQQLNQSAIILMMGYLLLGYFLFSSIHRHAFWERLYVIPRGLLIHYNQALKINLLLSSLSFTFYVAVSLAALGGDFALQRLRIQIVLNAIQYFFLLPAVGFQLGVLISFIKNQNVCYLILLVLLILFSPFPQMLFALTAFPVIVKLLHYVNLWPDAPYMPTPYSYGLEINQEKTNILLLWLFFTILLTHYLSIPKHTSNNKRLVTEKNITMVVLCSSVLYLGWQTSQPYSFLPNSKYIDLEGPVVDQKYYMDINKDTFASDETINKEGAFQILKYSGTISISDCLRANLQLEYTNLESQTMNLLLYHGFQVKDIWCGKNKIDFQQRGDTIQIFDKIPSAGTLAIRYHGHGGRYVSNNNAIFLPSGFPYYPMPDLHPLYYSSLNGFYPLAPAVETTFDIQINYKWPIYSNLSLSNDGHAEGSSQAMALFSGLYSKVEVDDTTLLYPALDPNLNSNKVVDFYQNVLCQHSPSKKRLIVVDDAINTISPYERYIDTDDFTLIGSLFPEDYWDLINAIWEFYPAKYQSYLFLKYAEKNDEEYHQRARVYEKNKNNYYHLYQFVEQNEEDRDERIAIIRRYIFDNNDARTPEEFIATLEGKFHD